MASPLLDPRSMKGQSARLRNAAGVELWRRFQRPLQDLQLWRELAQRLLDVTASLPDLPSIHTFLPQIEVRGRASHDAGGHQPSAAPVTLAGRACSGPSDIWAELTGPGLAQESRVPRTYQQGRQRSCSEADLVPG